jgi:hypothetical protein
MPSPSRWRELPRLFLAFVLFFVVIAALPSQALYWDDIGFLEWARDPMHLDYGHALYIPTLRAWHELMLLLDYTTEEYAAKMLSSLFAAAAFVLLWTRMERMGLSRTAAFALSALVGTTPLAWRQAGIVEPTTLTLTFLLCAARAAELYRESRTLPRAFALAACTALALGYHVVSVFVLPWLVHLAWGRPRPPVRHLWVPAGIVAALGLALLATGQAPVLSHFVGYWRGFLPTFSAAWLRETWREGSVIAVHGFALPLVLGTAGAVLLLARRRFPSALALALPYAGAFLLLGAPKVGLLLPVSLALGLVAAEALASAGTSARATLGEVLLALALAWQVASGLVQALDRAVTPDTLQEEALLMAAALPEGSLLLAGPAAHHVRWFTEVPCVALPNEIHSAPAAIDGRKDAIAVVRELVGRSAPSYADVYVSSEALDYLRGRWSADPSALPLDAARAIVVRADPPLALVPFARSGP